MSCSAMTLLGILVAGGLIVALCVLKECDDDEERRFTEELREAAQRGREAGFPVVREKEAAKR